MTDSLDTTDIDDDVIEALRPQERRYDVAIGDELVLSVLPNGVKTWTWVNADPSSSHRKTLGIYPDMSIEDARKSLGAEKAAYRRADESGSDFVIRDGHIKPASPSRNRLLAIAIAAVAVLVLIAVAWAIASLFAGDNADEPPAATADAVPATPQRAPAAEPVPDPLVLPPAVDATTIPDAEPDSTQDTQRVVAEIETQVATINERLEAELAKLEQVAPSATGTVPQDPQPAAPAEDSSAGTQRTAATNDRPTSAGSAATADVLTTRSADRPVAPDDTAVTDSRVARAVLTTAVEQREPVDDLGNAVDGGGAERQTYYFFTELRDLNGQRVRHRWVSGGQVAAEVPFDVGDSWRWRVYSSKTFVPEMAGRWAVEIVLDDGTVIHRTPFEFSP